jgi:cytidine deaminase
MREFCTDEFKILMMNPEGYEEVTLAQLLPFSFSNTNMV